MPRALTSGILVLALAACAGPSSPASGAGQRAVTAAPAPAPAKGSPSAAAARKDDDIVCTVEKVVGTSLRQKICRRQGDIDRDRLRTQDMVRQMQQVQTVK